MKKTIIVLTMAFIVAVCMFSLTACKSKHSHNYGEWQTITAPTCTESSEEKRTCSCGDTQRRFVEPTGHNLVAVEKQEYCEKEGVAAYEKCERCEKLFVDGKEVTLSSLTIPAAGHDYVAVAEKKATCETDGLRKHLKCARCEKLFLQGKEYEEKDFVIKAGHRFYPVSSEPKDSEYGGYLGFDYCYLCNKKFVNGKEVTDDYLVKNAPASGDNSVDYFIASDCIVGIDCSTYYFLYESATGSGGSIQYRNGSFDEMLGQLKPEDLPVTKKWTCDNGVAVDITFVGSFEYTYYQKGYLTDLNSLYAWINEDTSNPGKQKTLVSLSKCSEVGFVNDGETLATVGTKVVTYTYQGEKYTSSFIVVDEKVVTGIYADDRSLGSTSPKYFESFIGDSVKLYATYSDGTGEFLDLSAFNVAGTIEYNKIGSNVISVGSKDGKAHAYFFVRICDEDQPSDIRQTMYLEAGTTSFEYTTDKYYKGERVTYTIDLSSVLLVDYELPIGFKPQVNKEYTYIFIIDGNVADFYITFYDEKGVGVESVQTLFYDNVIIKDVNNPDLTGLYINVRRYDGTEDTIALTKDMVSFNESGTVMTVTYGGKSIDCAVKVADVSSLLPVEITLKNPNFGYGVVYAENRSLNGVYLMAAYKIDGEKCYLYMSAENGELFTLEGENYEPLNIATAAKGVHQNCAFGFGGQYTGQFVMYLYGTEDLTYSLDASVGFGGVTLTCGNKKDVLKELMRGRVVYSVGFTAGDSTYNIDSDHNLTFADLTIDGLDDIDYTKPGIYTIRAEYKNAETFIRLQIVPDESLYAYADYVSEDGNLHSTRLRLYENGYYKFSGTGTYEWLDKQNGVILTDGYELWTLTDGTYFRGVRNYGELVGEYDYDGSVVRMYKTSFGYALCLVDIDDDGDENVYGWYSTDYDKENSVLTFYFGTYKINADKSLTIIESGNELYKYEGFIFGESVKISFKDSGSCYIFRTYTDDDDQPVTTGYKYDYEKHGDYLLCVSDNYIAYMFKILPDGSLKRIN